MATKTELDEVIDQLAGICKPVVEAIEKATPTTKDNYGEYMAAISRIAAMIGQQASASTCLGIGVALQRAGANKAGVISALRVMGHI